MLAGSKIFKFKLISTNIAFQLCIVTHIDYKIMINSNWFS
jgi:hypothetical protein